jgi:dTDP-4-dehydrorhamnose 3,5-epimerase-like enzyme
MLKFGNIELLLGECNVSTIKDGRGGIFTWIPKEPIQEFNLVQFSKGKIRGNHFHPEFNEYILIVNGTFSIVTRDLETQEEIAMIASKGTCLYVPKNTPHALVASEDATCVSFLTKPWNKCENPIIREQMIEQDQEYKNFAKNEGFQYSAEEIRKNK